MTCAAALLAAVPQLAQAQEGYVVGITAALTGPASSTNAPVVEATRLYIDRLNAKGGVNGHPIRLVIQDDQAEASKAAANVTKLLTQDKVSLLINSSLSSTYAPTVAETKRAKVPLFFAGAVCPKEVYPPADPYQFCSTGYGGGYDSRMALGFIKEEAKGPAKIGFAAMAIPLSRGEMDYARSIAANYGLTPTSQENIPPPTPDYTPFATKLKGDNPDWVLSWAPWVTQVKTFEALRRLDWQGRYLAYSHIEAESELPRLKDATYYVFGANALFQDNLPVHREIREAAEKAKINYPVTQMTEGWIAGMVLEAVFKKVAFPATPEKVAAALGDISIDTHGLRGGPMVWTKDNHFRTKQYYRVYHWDTGKQAIALVKDWTGFDVK
jgi:ABC-type branched-subunit amino acid transport system substrate-binding protein